jgi:acyl-CoA dehydrogenase
MHALIHYDEVRLGDDASPRWGGQAFAIAQTRLGGGRIHHAMRTVGMCQKALDMMCERALSRSPGEPAGRQAVRAELRRRLLHPADAVPAVRALRGVGDRPVHDYRRVRHDIAAIKVLTPQVLHDIVQRSIQVHGALGVSNEMPLGGMWMSAPVMGLVDGPTEVHRVTVARQILKRYQAAPGRPLADGAPAGEGRRRPGEVRRVPRARGGQPMSLS